KRVEQEAHAHPGVRAEQAALDAAHVVLRKGPGSGAQRAGHEQQTETEITDEVVSASCPEDALADEDRAQAGQQHGGREHARGLLRVAHWPLWLCTTRVDASSARYTTEA